MMLTYNSLGVVEQKAGRLAEARAWYQKSRELAIQLKDQPGLGQAAQNIGIICQLEGEAAQKEGDKATAHRHFEEARRFVEESLQIWRNQANRPNEAASLNQLARIHLLLGDLSAAEQHSQAALQIRESLGLKEAWTGYNILSQIAAARGDTPTAAEWARKRDELGAELQRRAGGGGGIPVQMVSALTQLTLACVKAGFGGVTLGPDMEESLASIEGAPAPFPAFAAHLRQLANGELAPIPTGLLRELHEVLDQIHKAIKESG
jgi:tetratricopeptide (TPR) repeat protein